MINKQNLWFLTLFSLILVLSVYYITMPNDLLIASNQVDKSDTKNKVKANIEKSVENRGIEHLILDVEVPLEDVIEEKNGEEKVVKRKIFPGYVIIKMIMKLII